MSKLNTNEIHKFTSDVDAGSGCIKRLNLKFIKINILTYPLQKVLLKS